MPNPSQKPWADDPNTLYFSEKTNFAGILIGAILYGCVVVLFFQCVGAFLSPVNRTKGFVKWGLLAHTMAMFTVVTIYTAINLHIQSISYIENRDFPGTDKLPPKPLGYQSFIYFEPIYVVTNVMFVLNNWLADAMMLYRCYAIYFTQRWVIALPCLLYLGSLATGITFTYKISRPLGVAYAFSTVREFGITHYSISVSLNILLTLIIVTRLVLHGRGIRAALGPSASVGGWYKNIVTVLTESCALFTVTFLLFVAPWAAKNTTVANVFLPVVFETQVIAPFLVIFRVVNRSSASVIDNDIPATTGSIHFENHTKATSENRTFLDSHSASSADSTIGDVPNEHGIEVAPTTS